MLVGLALSIGAAYWGMFANAMWLATYFATPHLDTPKLLGTSESSLWRFIETFVCSGILVAAGAWLVWGVSSRRLVALILSLSLVQALPLFLSYPGGAGDVYAYAAEADIVLRYHQNPFSVPAASFPTSQLLPFLDYPAETTHYGPLWQAISVAIRFLAGPNLLNTLLLFKLAAVIALVATALIVYAYVLRTKPSAATAACLLVAWNPLMLVALAQDAHNDAVMMAFVALAFLLRSYGRNTASLTALLAAASVKYIPVIFIPLFLVASARGTKNWGAWARSMAVDALIMLGFTIILLSVTGIEGSLGVLQKMAGDWFTTSPGAVLYFRLLGTMSAAEAASTVGNATRLLFVAVYLALAGWLWVRPRELPAVALFAMLAFTATVTVWFEPWYAIWVIPVAALVGSPIAVGAVFGATAGGIAVYATMGFAWRLWWQTADKADVYARGTLAMWGPVLAGLAIGLAATWIQRRRFTRRAESSELLDEQTMG